VSRGGTAKGVFTVVVWIAAVAAFTIAIGVWTIGHRRADPWLVLLPYMPTLPDDFSAHAAFLGRSSGSDGLTLEVEVRGTPAEIRSFAAWNHLEPVTSTLFGGGADRWQLLPPGRPEAVVFMLLQDGGQAALLTVHDARPR